MTRAKIEKFYNKVGPICKLFHYNLFFKECFRTAIGFCELNENTSVLEVGVGTGLSFPYYPRNCPVIGIDLSQTMLKQSKKSMKNLGSKNIVLKRMNATQLDFPDNSFDYVMAFMTLTACADPVKVLKEMDRVCKLGGKIVLGNHF